MATPFLQGSMADFLVSIFVFILLFSILYGLLSKLDLFGENKAVHIFIAFATSVLVLFIPEFKELINFMTPWFVIFIIFIILIMLAIMTLGIKQSEITDHLKSTPGLLTFLVIVIVIIFLAAVYHVFGPVLVPAPAGDTSVWGTITRGILNVKMLGVIFLLLIAALIVKTIGFESKK